MTKAEFLSRLSDEARGALSLEVTQSLVLEVSEHLDASIQARLELGEPPEVAEVNAVAAFAEPKSFVAQMETVHEVHRAHDRVLLALGSFLVLSFTFVMQIAGLGVVSNEVFLETLGVTLIAILIRSWTLGTPRLGTLKVLTIASVLLIGGLQPLLTLNLWSYGGIGNIPSNSVQRYIDTQRELLKNPDEASVHRSPFEAEQNLRAVDLAAHAPLPERWLASFRPSGGLAVFTLSCLILAHLLPVAVRRRLRLARARMRRA